MTLALTYKVDSGTSIDLGAVYLSTITGLTTCANQGTVGSSMLTVPDKGGLLDTILGLRRFHAHEDASPSGNRRIYSAWTANRRYHRGRFLTGADRMIDVSLVDMNNFLSTNIIRTIAGTPPVTGVRPAETDLERIAWLLASPFITLVEDYGLVSTTGGVDMDANDYTDSNSSDVLRDCGIASGKNWFVYNDEIPTDAERFGLFYDFTIAEVFTSTLRLSNHPGDADGVTTFEMWPDVEMDRDPSEVISGVNINADGFSLFVKDTDIGLTTAATYYSRQVNSPAPQVKTTTKAQALGERYLNDNDTEDDTATVRVLIPKEYVGLIRAGHRISCRFDHFPTEYRDFTWWRILEQTIALDLGSEEQPKPVDYYNMTLKLTPIPPPLCSVALSRAVTAHITDQVGASGSYGISATPSGLSAVIAGFVAGGTSMSLSGPGFTTLHSEANTGHETLANGWASASSPETVIASYTRTGNPQAAVIAAFLTSAASPVQTAVGVWGNGPLTATLASPPTPGNMLVAVVTGSANANPMTLGPSSGWTISDFLVGGHSLAFLDEGQCNGVHPFGGDAVAIFAGCVEAGWGAAWTYGGSGSPGNFYTVTLMEWAL